MDNLISIDELYRIYDEYNVKYFQSQLSDNITIEWSSRLTRSAGICYMKKKIIRLSTHYHMRYPQDIKSTLLHEMIHLIIPGHGREFKEQVERINGLGGKVSRYSRERAKIPEKFWLYICPICSKHIIRTARLHKSKHYKCTECSKRCEEYRGQREIDGSIKTGRKTGR